MSEGPDQMPTPAAAVPAVSRRRVRISMVWLVPAVAALIGLSMLIHGWWSAGPVITITFRTATGLQAGRTPVKYKDVTVGSVTDIRLSDDGSHVSVKVSLIRTALNLTRADTRFWVVRPRVGLSGISGIDTLVSGAYLAVDVGSSAETSSDFTGLEVPPNVISGTAGKTFLVRADDLGSLDIGSPVYHRRIQVGRVASFQLDPEGKDVRLQIFVEQPYDKLVTANARFWNASGLDFSLGANGLQVRTQSMASILAGGIAFATPVDGNAAPAAEGAQFSLFKDQQTAMAPPDGEALAFQLHFERSLRGLAVGAPVDFSGVNVGRVASIDLDYEPNQRRFPTIVGILVYPQRLGRILEKLPRSGDDPQQQVATFLREMVNRGLRAQVRSGNLLTGQLYVSMDYVPNAPPVTFDVDARPLIVPTASGGVDRLQEQLVNVVGKIEKMPLDSVGRNLDATLATLDRTLKQIDGKMLPETTLAIQRLNQTLNQVDGRLLPQATQALEQARQTLGAAQGLVDEDAPLQQSLNQTLRELQQSARSLRALTDLLGRQPESLLRGRADDPLPALSGPRPAPVSPNPRSPSP